MDTDKVIELVQSAAVAWNRRDLESYLELLTEDVIWVDPGAPAPISGREGVREFAESVWRAFPDFTIRIREPICVAADGSRCAVPWCIRATHLHSLTPPGFSPTNQSAEFEGVDLVTFRESRICRIDTYFDTVVPAEQLLKIRLRPRPGTLHEKLIVGVQKIVAAWVRYSHRLRN